MGRGLVAATMVMVAVGRWPGWRGLWCPARLSFQFDILRLITRGLWRGGRCAGGAGSQPGPGTGHGPAVRGEKAAWAVTWRRTRRRVRVNEMRSGSVPASSAAWCMRVRMA